jgi:hypothetical protein
VAELIAIRPSGGLETSFVRRIQMVVLLFRSMKSEACWTSLVDNL